MFKLVNHIEANKGGKHLKFPTASHPKGPYKHQIVIRVDTCADVNYMNEKTFNEPFPEVQLSVCPHEIQNFRNSVADISILGQFCTYLEFRGEKYLNTLIVTNVNDFPNILSYGVTFRMGALLPNYPQEIVVKQDNVPHFSKMRGGKMGNSTPNGTSIGTSNGVSYVNTGNGTASGTLSSTSNMFQILNNIWKRQRAVQYRYDSSMAPTVPEMATPFRTTTPSAPASMTASAKQANPVRVNALPVQNTSWSTPPAPSTHVHKPLQQVLKPRDLLALRNVQHLHNGRTCVNRLPLMKQDILSHYFSCFEGIGHFAGDPYKFHLKPEHKPARHAPRKVPIHLEDAFKEKIKSLVELGILEEVKEHTD